MPSNTRKNMPIEKTITVYKFDELGEGAQRKVLSDEASLIDDEWYDWIINDWIVKLEDLGFFFPDIRFSGFGCQGDGASFTCEKVELSLYLNDSEDVKFFTREGLSLSLSVTRDYDNYVHENSVSVAMNFNPEASDYEVRRLDRLENEINERVRELSKEIYSDLETEWDRLTSPEALKESLVDSDRLFYLSGVEFFG